MKRSTAVTSSSSLLILLFAYTAFHKLVWPGRFRDVLWQSPLIGPGADIVALLVPLTELALVLLLFFPNTRRAGFFGSLTVLGLFTTYLLYLLLTSADLPCECGGVISGMGWKTHVVFNLFFMGVAVTGIRKSAPGETVVASG